MTRKMKKGISVFLVLCMLLTLMPATTALAVSDWTQLGIDIAAVPVGGSATITLTGSFDADTAIVIDGEREITLSGPFEIMQETPGQRHFRVIDGTLILDGVTLRGPGGDPVSGDPGTGVVGGVRVYGDGTLVMEPGSVITENRGTATGFGGGGVYVSDGGSFYMHGGEITDNRAVSGAGVSLRDGTFTMTDGTISGNRTTGATGGGVRVTSSSSFYMSGGTISDNRAGGNGGGVDNAGIFVLSGGTISDNATAAFGGGVNSNGTFTMTDDEPIFISGNTAGSWGGGVHVGGTAIMHAGSIIDNNAGLVGGGVSVFNGTFTLNNGVISGNGFDDPAFPSGPPNNGGGVALLAVGTFIMNDGEISDNTAAVNGGGIFLQSNTGSWLTINGGTVSDNTATNGGGVGFAAPITLNDFRAFLEQVIIEEDAEFFGNTATAGTRINETLRAEFEDDIAPGDVTAPHDHAFTNHDIHMPQEFTLTVINHFLNANALNDPAAGAGTFAAGTEVTVNRLLNRPGWAFVNWTFVNADGVTVPISSPFSMPAHDLAVTANWTWIGGGTPPPPPPPPPCCDDYPDCDCGVYPGEYPWREAFIIGTPDGLIRPMDNITRAEVATIFFRLIDDDVREEYWEQENPFTDVELYQWFNNAVSTATNLGIFEGIGDDLFAPFQDITRAEIAAALVRFMDRDTIGPFVTPQSDDHFNDIAGHWAQDYINRAAEEGWIEGPDGLGGPFNPDQTATRAEVAAIVNRVFQRLIETPECRLPDMVTWPDNPQASAGDEDSWFFLYIYMASNSYTYRWRTDSDRYKELVELIEPREWWRLERPDSVPDDIFIRG